MSDAEEGMDDIALKELTATLRTQVESLSRERDNLNELYVSTEEKLLVATRERDQARAACAVMRDALEYCGCHEHYNESPFPPSDLHKQGPCEFCNKVDNALKDNPGQPILDQLHAYQSGVVEAVADLDLWCSTGYTGHCLDAMETLRPLVTPKEGGK